MDELEAKIMRSTCYSNDSDDDELEHDNTRETLCKIKGLGRTFDAPIFRFYLTSHTLRIRNFRTPHGSPGRGTF